jgi:hypothetical protein
VIVAQEVQQAVQSQHPVLGRDGVPFGAGLTGRDAARNDDISQWLRAYGPRLRAHGKGQYIRRGVLAAERAIQRSDGSVGDERDGDGASRAQRCRPSEPARQPWRGDAAPETVGDRDGKTRGVTNGPSAAPGRHVVGLGFVAVYAS